MTKACEGSLQQLRRHIETSSSVDAAEAKQIVGVVVSALNRMTGDVHVSEDGWFVIGELAIRNSQHPEILAAIHQSLESLDAGFEEAFQYCSGVWVESGVELGEHSLPAAVMAALMGLSKLRLKGIDALELCAGNTDFAVQVLKAVASRGGLLSIAASATLLDLTLPDSHFAADAGTEAQAVEVLTKRYKAGCTALIKAVVKHRVFETFCEVLLPAISQPCQGCSVLHSAMAILMRILQNLLVYASENTAQLRKHIAVESQVIPAVLLPYIAAVLEMVAQVPEELQRTYRPALRLGLQTLIAASFNIAIFNQRIRDNNPTLAVLSSPGLASDMELVALCVKLNTNIAFAGDTEKNIPLRAQQAEAVVTRLREVTGTLDAAQWAQLQRYLGPDSAQPVQMSGPSWERLQEWIPPAMEPPGENGPAAATPPKQSSQKK